MGAALKLQNPRGQANAVIYARYSSHGQQDQSIDGQLRDCYAFAKREGLLVVGEYIDRAISAKTDDRPDFRRMISDAAKKQFQYVIVWKLDRFARNRFDSAIHKATLKKYGVKVLSAMENITDDPSGALMEGILESMAQHYSDSLSENVRRGQRESILKGSHLGGIAPFGFKSVRIDGKLHLVADEEKAPIIKYVFEEYAKGTTKKKIMENLTARGLVNSRGNSLKLSSLQTALRNKKYIGVYEFGGEIVENACDALIDEHTFNRVQDMLDSRSHGKNAKKVRQEYLLHGKVFCGHCGTRLVGDGGTSKTGKAHYYYACAKRKKHHTCDKLNEKKDFLEWYVVEQAVEILMTRSNIEDIATGVVKAYREEFNDTRIKELERQLRKLDKEVDSLVTAIASGPQKAAAKLMERVEILETQKIDIERNLASLRLAARAKFTKDEVVAWLKSFCKGDLLNIEYQRKIINILVNSVYVYDDKVVFYFNLRGSEKQVSYIDVCNDMEGLTPLDENSANAVDKGGGKCYNEENRGSDSKPTPPPKNASNEAMKNDK